MTCALETTWDLLLEARSVDWTQHEQITRTVAGGELTLSRSGEWFADFSLDREARVLLQTLTPLATAESLVVAQLGQSLDGRIATCTGHSHYINGPVALTHLHRLRALVDAVIVGAETACVDRPRLTVRHVPGPNPARVILDPRGRVSFDGPMFDPVQDASRVLHLVGPDAEERATTPTHVERVRVDPSEQGFAPSDILSTLEGHGLRRILVEGGARTISRFLQADAIDRLHLLLAPLIIGSGRSGIELPAINRLEDARRPRMRSFELDDELLIDVDLGVGAP